MPGLPPLTVVPLFPLILLCPLSRSGFIFFFSFFLIFCFVTVGVYLHEPVVVAFNFLHGVLFMIAKLPCSSGRQGVRRGTQCVRVLGVSMVALSISVCGIWMINVFT